MTSQIIVVAIGGNMLISKPQDATYEKQMEKSRAAAKILAELVSQGNQVVITHGNGPQVGNLLLQQKRGMGNGEKQGVPELPLRILTAMTQTQIGVMLQLALINEFRARGIERDVIVVPTSVRVELSEEMIKNPTKPVGPFFPDEEFEKLEDKSHFKKFPKGWRKLVPSPTPKSIVEARIIKQLVEQGKLVIAVGGGGTPVVQEGDSLQPVDGVIDKDRASAVLAKEIGADQLIILTNVDAVFKNYGSEEQKEIRKMTASEAKVLLESGELGQGTMFPKVEACHSFVQGDRTALITSDNRLFDALSGDAGTTITADQL